jgi:hypothetical protein
MSDNSKIFQSACLLQFSTSIWQCTKALNPAVLKGKVDIESDWFKGRKFLINSDLLGPIHTAVHQARNHIVKNALPFPMQSIYLVPKDRLDVIDDRMKHYKQRFWDCVDEFIPMYNPAREEARQVLGDLFNEADYPEDISKKFRFEWRYLVLGLPGKSSVLTPEIYQREKEKFQLMMEETRELAVSALCEEFSDVVSHLTEKLNGNGVKPKTVKSSLFNSLREFLDDLTSRNLFDDAKIKELSDQARSLIDGVNPYQLQYNTQLRNKIHGDMMTLKTTIDESIMELPRRKMRLAA